MYYESYDGGCRAQDKNSLRLEPSCLTPFESMGRIRRKLLDKNKEDETNRMRNFCAYQLAIFSVGKFNTSNKYGPLVQGHKN